MPSTPQDRWFATLWLLKPAIFATLALFWFISGVVGLLQYEAAIQVLDGSGLSDRLAGSAVVAGSVADITVGLAVLLRPTARMSLMGMLVLTVGYMAGSALFAPHLWVDPLGAMVKTLPVVVLIFTALAILEDR